MNKTETIKKIAELSGINEEDSGKVLDALEKIFQEELSQSQGWKCAFHKIHLLFSYLKNN